MRYMLSVLIVLFAAGCAETGGQRLGVLAEAYNRDLQYIRTLRPHARDILPEKLSDRDVTLLLHFSIYRSEFKCRVISKYREAAEALGCVAPEEPSKAAPL